MFDRLGDFLADRRFPWNRADLPRLSSSKTDDRQLLVALTFDVEQDGGSGGSGKTEKIRPFLETISDWLGKRSATFFIQGSLVETFKTGLKRLTNKNELGVHAWSHDRLWGDPVWFLSEKPLPRSEKESHLRETLASFKKAGLPRPRSFRATNLVIDEETLSLLGRFRFTVDSSWDSFRDFRRPFKVNNLWEIPVSSLPQPRPRWGIFKDYQVLNMANIKRLSVNQLEKNVNQIVMAQKAPYLVFMAHSWDFKKREFTNFINLIEKKWSVRYLTMVNLAKQL